MKRITKYITTLLLSLFVMGGSVFAQQSRDLQYYTQPDQRGLNQFEAPFMTDVEFDGLNVRIGGANALQFQALTHDNDLGTLPELENNFNLATSNLDVDVALANGLRMHLRTYLSSQHHTETYVKGGYMQVDRLDFISEGFASELMDHVRIKIGHMENNYGDAHFRRTDNAQAIHNPFVGNYIMDSFTTEVGGEVYVYGGDVFAMLSLTNGKLNQSTIESEDTPNFIGKLGYDSQINDELRFRLTGSIFTTPETGSIYLYSGDRAGSRYYNVLNDDFRSGRFDPGFTLSGRAPGGPINGEMTSIMINPFLKYQGLELFGLLEFVSGKRATETDDRKFTQYGVELVYRLGENENVYLGGRYNLVSGDYGTFDVTSGALTAVDDIDIERFNIGGGWFLTKNVLAKVEYVNQTWSGFPAANPATEKYVGAEFDGVMLEAVISF